MYCEVLAVILWISCLRIAATTPACCPIGWSLVRISDFEGDKYECNATAAPGLAADYEVFEKTLPLYGYRIYRPDNAAYVPQCSHQMLASIGTGENVDLPPYSCLVSIAGRMAAVSCPLQDEEHMQRLSVAHKCCPVTHVYDAGQRKCIKQTSDFMEYGILFEDTSATVFIDTPIDCLQDKVLIEYHLNDKQFSIDDGKLMLRSKRKIFQMSDYCIEAIKNNKRMSAGENSSTVHDSVEFLVRTCEDLSACNRVACIRRCCADGEMFVKGNAGPYCKRDETDLAYHSFESLEISGNFSQPAVFGILRGLNCLKFRLNPEIYSDDAHIINTRDGSLYVANSQNAQKNYTNDRYCVEKIRSAASGDQTLYTFLCFDSKVVNNDKLRFRMYPIGLLISCSFYAITLLVYLSISRLRNLPGKILICLVCSLFTAYLAIAIGQLTPTSHDNICFASGFFIYFCLMSAFAWMNVMCFDIWQTFGSAKKKRGFKGNQDKRFLLYSLYGWGLPTVLTVITVSLTKSDLLSDNIKPHFGHGRCWFTYDAFGAANLIFFSGPVGLLFLINFVLFALTLRYCNRVKREIFRMQSSNMEKPMLRRRFFVDKARFAMNTKLFIVMGITWFLELLSIVFYDHKKTFFWIISDSFNVLLGVFVFFIFVFKKRIWYSVLEKLGFRAKENAKLGPNGTFTTQSTCAQSISMTRFNAIENNPILLSPGAISSRRSPSFSL